MKAYLLVMMIGWLTMQAHAQKVTISGYVADSASGEKLIGANVYDALSLKGTTTNSYGFYSLTLDPGDVDLTVSYIGYGSYSKKISLEQDVFLNIPLSLDNVLTEVVVSGSRVEKVHEKTQMSTIQVPMKQVEKLPAFMGEKDVIKTVQLLPGVQSGSEGSSGLYVRGGGPDQNLILLDGVPVYNASHLFGFFSVFNSSAINNIELIKGGFPARYGGRISSVLDIRMKEGNTKDIMGEASLGLISSKLTLEGPLINDKTSFIISGRRTYIDILAAPFIRLFSGGGKGGDKEDGGGSSSGNNVRAGYYFYDLNAKVNHQFSEKSRLFLSTYLGNDKAYSRLKDNYQLENTDYQDESDANLRWGNITTAVRYNRILNKKLFANVTGTYSRYKFLLGSEYHSTITPPDTAATEEFNGFDYTSGIDDWGVKIDLDYIPLPNHYIRFGVGETYHTFTPGVNTYQLQSSEANVDTTFGSSKVFAHELYAYVEDDIKFGNRFKINPGLHFSTFLVQDSSYLNLQPRLAMNYLLTESLAIKASYARSAQYLHLLTNATIGLPTDLWVPVTDTIPAVTADQVALGLAYTYNNKYEFSVEGYYKRMANLIEYKDGASFFGSSQDWQTLVEVGDGRAYGVEFFVQKKIGQTSGWIGYTLSWTDRQFDNLNFGEPFPYKFDRRHDVSLALVHELDKKLGQKQWQLDLGLIWVYGTGNAISLPISSYRALNADVDEFNKRGSFLNEIDNYESRNDFREPSYHRLDVSATFTNTNAELHKIWNISVYNVYNRKNPFYLFIDYNSQNQRVLKQISLFPIIPAVSYTLKF